MKPEQTTRQEKIDLQLGRAGWALGSRRLVQEFLISAAPPFGDDTKPYRTRNEFADYALVDRLGRVLAMQKAEVATLEALRQAPFTSIGDPEALFGKSELEDLLKLTRSVAA